MAGWFTERIVKIQEKESPLSGVIEVDESYIDLLFLL